MNPKYKDPLSVRIVYFLIEHWEFFAGIVVGAVGIVLFLMIAATMMK